MKVKVLGVAPAIDKNGAQRSFTSDKDGSVRQCWDVELELMPRDDVQHKDTVIAEYVNEDGKGQPFADVVGKEEILDANISFQVREYNGRKFNTIKLWKLQTSLF